MLQELYFVATKEGKIKTLKEAKKRLNEQKRVNAPQVAAKRWRAIKLQHHGGGIRLRDLGFPVTRIRYGRIRQDTAGYGKIRQDTAGYGRIRQDTAGSGRIRQDTAGYGRIRRIRQDTAGYGRIRQIRQDTAGYGRIRQDTTGSKISACLHYENNHFAFIQRLVVFHTVLACLL